jgi:serine/threonine protein kinase
VQGKHPREPNSPPPDAASSRESISFLKPPEHPGELGQLGPYSIQKILGQGGMGFIFLARDRMLDRPVALKVMKPEAANRDNRERFFREARAIAALAHDHIVPIFLVGEESGIPYLVMPVLSGETLDARLARDRKPSLKEVVRIAREISLGLVAAHERGLIHRDIKPGNIWLESPRGRVRILDFGLVRNRFQDVRITQNGAIMGTPSAGAGNNNSLAYPWPGGQPNHFFPDPNTSRNILRNTVTPQQRVQFALNLCQHTTNEALSWVQARSDSPSGSTGSDAFKSKSTNNLRSASPPAGVTQGVQRENPVKANPAPSQTKEMGPPFRGMDAEQMDAPRTPDALVKEYEEFIEKDISSLLEILRSPSNKKDLEPLVQQLSENAMKWTKLAKDNPQQADWITKMINLSRQGIAKIEARYR